MDESPIRRVRARHRRLQADARGRDLHLAKQPLDLLVLFVRRPGELITREEIRAALWGSSTFVDSEHSINTAIGKIRAALRDDPTSPQYRRWQSFTLSDRNHLQVYIPAKFGNSFLVMSDIAIFHYKQTNSYNRAGQFTIKWNDPAYKFWWPVEKPILSQRDFA